jgi:hypothetical protein
MSLLRLLTAGKSLVGLKKSERRYHLPGESALPKFGSKKNPFRATTLPEQTDAAPEVQNPPRSSPSLMRGEDKEQDRASEPRQERSLSPVARSVCDRQESDPTERVKPVEQLEHRPKGFRAFLLWGRAKARRPALPGGRPMVQGELSLDNVRVVRNDLTESDVEIVGRASPAKQPASPENLEVTESRKPAAEPGWGAVAGRLLSLGKM